MTKLCELPFKDFWWSMFVEDNGEENGKKGWILQSQESKIVDSSDDGFYDKDFLVSSTRRVHRNGSRRWRSLLNS